MRIFFFVFVYKIYLFHSMFASTPFHHSLPLCCALLNFAFDIVKNYKSANKQSFAMFLTCVCLFSHNFYFILFSMFLCITDCLAHASGAWRLLLCYMWLKNLTFVRLFQQTNDVIYTCTYLHTSIYVYNVYILNINLECNMYFEWNMFIALTPRV